MLVMRGAAETVMRFITASLSLGLFTWLSYMVFTGKLGDGVGTSGRAGFISGAITSLIEQMGVNQTALALLGFGALLSFTIIVFGPRDDEA